MTGWWVIDATDDGWGKRVYHPFSRHFSFWLYVVAFAILTGIFCIWEKIYNVGNVVVDCNLNHKDMNILFDIILIMMIGTMINCNHVQHISTYLNTFLLSFFFTVANLLTLIAEKYYREPGKGSIEEAVWDW